MKQMPPTVVISLDFELAWGSFDKAYGKELLDCARWTHDFGVPVLLKHLSRTNLSATWATVGLTMLDRLAPVDDLAEVSYPHFPKPWFEFIPRQATEAEAPEWFGASVLRQIREATPYQEIGFHSWSHVIFADPGTPRERARQEFERCAALSKELGFDAESFVYPRNSVAHLDILREVGFKCYRSEDVTQYASLPSSKARAISGVLADFLGLTPKVVQPFLRDGLVAIPGSLMVRYLEGWRRLIPDVSRARRLRTGLREVTSKGGVFHVWLHPENLYYEKPRLERVLARFLDEVRRLVDQGKLRCLTMGQLADEFLAKASRN